MEIHPVPCLKDNYAYLVAAATGNGYVVVDPSEAAPVLEALDAVGGKLLAVWNTHHHWDHVGGNLALAEQFPGLPVYGHVSDRGRNPGQTHDLNDGDTTDVLPGRPAKIIFNPGHTSGAVSYYVPSLGAVFTGDTMFASGCGRLFEGTPEQMFSSLTRLASLDPATKVYFGHEYTAANLAFAAAVEPENPAIATRRAHILAARAAGHQTTPSLIADELATNPFVRAGSAARFAARRHAKDTGDLSGLAALD